MSVATALRTRLFREHARIGGRHGIPKPWVLAFDRRGFDLIVRITLFGFAIDWAGGVGHAFAQALRDHIDWKERAPALFLPTAAVDRLDVKEASSVLAPRLSTTMWRVSLARASTAARGATTGVFSAASCKAASPSPAISPAHRHRPTHSRQPRRHRGAGAVSVGVSRKASPKVDGFRRDQCRGATAQDSDGMLFVGRNTRGAATGREPPG